MKILTLSNPQSRRAACQYVMQAPDGFVCRIGEPTRSLEANALMWVVLTRFAEQLQWPVNGKLMNLSPEEWKDILTAAFEGESVRLAQGLDGGVVMLGRRTSKYGQRKMGEFIEFLYATASERDVIIEEMEAA